MARLGDPIPMPKYSEFGSDWEKYYEAQNKAFAALDQSKIIKWQRADGYALYFVESMKPLVLRHIPYLDAWTVEPALIRGLRVSDVQQMMYREKSLRRMFSRE